MRCGIDGNGLRFVFSAFEAVVSLYARFFAGRIFNYRPIRPLAVPARNGYDRARLRISASSAHALAFAVGGTRCFLYHLPAPVRVRRLLNRRRFLFLARFADALFQACFLTGSRRYRLPLAVFVHFALLLVTGGKDARRQRQKQADE